MSLAVKVLSSALTGGSVTGRASRSGLAWFPSLPGLGCSGFVLFLCSGASSGLVFTLMTLSEFLLLRILNEYCRHLVRVVASGGARIQRSPSPSRPPVSPCGRLCSQQLWSVALCMGSSALNQVPTGSLQADF